METIQERQIRMSREKAQAARGRADRLRAQAVQQQAAAETARQRADEAAARAAQPIRPSFPTIVPDSVRVLPQEEGGSILSSVLLLTGVGVVLVGGSYLYLRYSRGRR